MKWPTLCSSQIQDICSSFWSPFGGLSVHIDGNVCQQNQIIPHGQVTAPTAAVNLPQDLQKLQWGGPAYTTQINISAGVV